jgi:4-aminobutyrate aminotransferase/(S)-3-amino-2-methylpropionate transaminase
MKGIELRHPNSQPAGNIVIALVTQLLKKGLILLPDGPLGDVIALTPPITITPEEIDHSTQLIASTLTQLA